MTDRVRVKDRKKNIFFHDLLNGNYVFLSRTRNNTKSTKETEKRKKKKEKN